ncbi:MAG: PAS domain S-box protein [Bacteroidota bacterium]|nr:PAS domain S-box protein [Bacteroidota bacterium]
MKPFMKAFPKFKSSIWYLGVPVIFFIQLVLTYLLSPFESFLHNTHLAAAFFSSIIVFICIFLVIKYYKNVRETCHELAICAIRYKTLFESANDAIFLMKGETFIDCNQKTLEMFGCKREEIIGQPPYKFSPLWQPDGRDSKESALEKINAALAGMPQRFEWQHIKLNGTPFDVEVSLNKVEVNNECMIQAIVRDISERKVAEKAIHEFVTHFSVISEQLPATIWTVNKNLEFTSSTGLALKKLGLEKNQVVGSTLFDYFKTDDPDFSAIKYHLKALEGIKSDYDIVWNGRYLQSSVEPLKNVQGEIIGVIGVALDVTERIQTEIELQKKEEIYKTLVTNANDAIYLITNESFIYVNPKFEEITGYKQDEICNPYFNFTQLLTPKSKIIVEARRLARQRGETIPSKYGFQIITKTGQVKEVETNTVLIPNNSNTLQILGIMRDITEKITAYTLQQKLQMQLEIFFRTSMDGCFFMLIPEGEEFFWNDSIDIDKVLDFVFNNMKITMANKAMLEQYGAKDESELIGLSTNELYRHDVEYGKRGLREFLDKGYLRIVTQERKFNGEQIWIDGQYVVMLNEEGKVFGYFGVQRDITEKLKEEEEKKKLEFQLFQSQKLEALGTLSGGIAHDINNILGIIVGAVELAKLKTDNKEIEDYLGMISNSADRAVNVVKQLLFFTRAKDINLQPLSPIKLIQDIQNILIYTLPKNIDIKVEINTDNKTTIYCDESLIQQTLMNIAINARDAMPDGGNLIFSVNELSCDEIKHKLGIAVNSKFLIINISDTGHGIDEAIQNRIFDPFYTTKEQGKGTGLGLSIVYRIIKQHNGYIDVTSQVGHGTTFSIYLPIIVEPPAEAPSRPPSKKDDGHRTILVIDDEDMLRSLLTEMLTDSGYKVLVASNGLEAIEIYQKQKNEIDLVISDIGMPKMGGEETFKQLKLMRGDVKLIFISGFLEIEKKIELENLGICGFIQKPFQAYQLLNFIHQILKL